MNIIDREIAERKALIDSKAEKVARLEALRAEENELLKDIESIDVESLTADINELEEIKTKLLGQDTETPVVE